MCSNDSAFVVFQVSTLPAELRMQNSPVYWVTHLLSIDLTEPILQTALNVWPQLNQQQSEDNDV